MIVDDMLPTRTSHSHPLIINAFPLHQGHVGMTFCPGKKSRNSVSGCHWDRDLDSDLQTTFEWGATHVLSLMVPFEYELLGVKTLLRTVIEGQAWHHLPIIDRGIPGVAFMERWAVVGAFVQDWLKAGDRVLVHCRGGLGRTGVVAAMMLIDAGVDPGDAIRRVRACRPGTIENASQEAFVMGYVSSP